MELNSSTIQSVLLDLLANPNTDARLGQGNYYLAEALRSKFAQNQQPDAKQIMAAIWSLVAQGLAYIDFRQPSPDNWYLRLTDQGLAAISDKEMNPDNSGEYINRLQRSVPEAKPAILQYAREALVSYNNRCYLASAVMLGVASEAAFLELANSFGNWLPTGQRKKFLEIINNPRGNYIAKFGEFRKRIEPLKANIPDDLSDGMSLTFDSVLDLLRIYRNDAGHPTGKKISRDDAFINLQMFARYLQRLYSFKRFFDSAQSMP